MACGDPPLWWPGPMHVIDYGQYSAPPWPTAPTAPATAFTVPNVRLLDEKPRPRKVPPKWWR